MSSGSDLAWLEILSPHFGGGTKGQGVHRFSKNTLAAPKFWTPEGWLTWTQFHTADPQFCSDLWPLTVIWRPLLDACELQQMKKIAVILLKIWDTAVQNLVPRDLCSPAEENHENWQANRTLCRDLNQGSPQHGGGVPPADPWRLFRDVGGNGNAAVTVLRTVRVKWGEHEEDERGKILEQLVVKFHRVI